jgi:O-antigen ligase
MTALSFIARFDRAFLVRLADWLAVAVGIALPWSTTAVGICIAAWLLAVLPTLDAAAVRREVMTAVGGLPILLWCLGVVGMVWADVGWHERLDGLGGFNRLLVIPLLFAHFSRSSNGAFVVGGFFISSVALLITSFVRVIMFKGVWLAGVPVHDTIFQGTIFLICGFGALGYSVLAGGKVPWFVLAAIGMLGVMFLVNFAFVTASRTAFVIAPLLLVLLGWRLLGWKGLLGGCVLGVVIGTITWVASPVVRGRIDGSIRELQEYRTADKQTSIGEHLAFLNESLTIVASAPLFGHGTGSIPEQFRRVTIGKTGVSAEPTVNPHNQTFAVAIQLGLVGALVLWAMWLAHLLLFGGPNITAWFGLLVVVENILSSIAHTHLFDFNSGWLYVFGVGVLGGMVMRERANLSKTGQ